MSSPEYRSGSRRSRSKSRSRTPARRRYSRSRSQSGSEGESYGGSGQDNNFPPPGDVLHEYASNGWDVQGFPHLGDGPVIKTPEEPYIKTTRTVLRRDRPKSNALVPVISLDTQRMSHQILLRIMMTAKRTPPLKRRNWPSNRRQWELLPTLRCRPWRATLSCTRRSVTWSCGASASPILSTQSGPERTTQSTAISCTLNGRTDILRTSKISKGSPRLKRRRSKSPSGSEGEF